MQSCLDVNDDAESLMSDNIPVNAALATVVVPGEAAGEAMIESDSEGRAYVVNPTILTYHKANNEGQRIFYTYRKAESPSGDNGKSPFIEIIYLKKILTKPVDILKEGDEDTYGHDRINYLSYNIGKTHLTLQFQLLMTNGSNISHRISLVAKSDAVPDADGYLAVELRHNAEGDIQQHASNAEYVSFPLSSAPGYKEGTLKGFKMKYNSIYNGEETVTISFTTGKSTTFPFNWEGTTSNTKIK